MTGPEARFTEAARILVSVLPGETRCAVLRAERLEDLLILRADRPRLLGNIYLGRVLEISSGLDAAFMDVGLPQPGLLPRGEAPGRKQLGHALSNGDQLVVKVVREASEDKGVRLTTRIQDPPADMEQLSSQAKAPALLMAGEDRLLRLIAQQGEIEAILVDDSAFARGLREDLRPYGVAADKVTSDPALRPLFEREGVEEQIEALFDPQVDLPGGGSLLVEPVRTLTAIDVNLGRMAASGKARSQALAVNLEAVAEIARQLRLRSIAGLIVVDFLEMRDRTDRDRVVSALKSALKDGGQPCQVMGMSPSGLLEMTRKRAGPTLSELLTEPAGEQDSGRQRRPETLAFEALRSALREAGTAPGAEIRVKASQSVVTALRDGAAAEARRLVERRLGQDLQLEVLESAQKGSKAILHGLEVSAVRR